MPCADQDEFVTSCESMDRERMEADPSDPDRATMIRKLIADDHPVVREGLKRLIEDCPDIRMIDEVGFGKLKDKVGN